jgi:hypothetical protein
MRRRYSLLTLLLVFSMSFNIEEPTTLTARVGSLPSVSAQFPGFQLELHWDQSGDLWVETPFYIWNITGEPEFLLAPLTTTLIGCRPIGPKPPAG